MNATPTGPRAADIARIVSGCQDGLHPLTATAIEVERAIRDAVELGSVVLSDDRDRSQLVAELAKVAYSYKLEGPAKLVRRMMARAVREAQPSAAASCVNVGDELPDGVDPFTDLAQAHRLVRLHGANIRHCPAFGGWMFWDETRWRHDEAAVARLAIDVAKWLKRFGVVLSESARSSAESERADQYFAFAKKAQSEPAIRRALNLAQNLETVCTTADVWDRDPDLLSCANGTIDLRTAELRPHRREDLITRLAPVGYEPNAFAPTWDRFIAEILPSLDVARFAMRAAGYSLTGHTHEQCLMVCHGTGANGKSTMLETLRYVAGDYASHAQTDTLMRVGSRGADNDLARLRSARLVTAIESGEGRRLDEERVKQLTGSDTIAARFLYAEAFEFRPVMKIWLACNHKPEIAGTDEGIWRRLRLIPFGVEIPPEQRDPDLQSKLRAEAAGILAWAVRGAVEWRNDGGLKPPTEVLAASNAWRADSDAVAQFIEEQCTVADFAKVRSGALYAAYRSWCIEQGTDCLTQRAVADRLQRLGYKPARTNADGRVWSGLGLRAEEHDA